MTNRSAEAFAGVEPGSGEPYDCTPEIGDDEVGIRVNAPEHVSWSAGDADPITGAFARVLICGIYRLAAADLYGTEGVYTSATLVATNERTHRSYSAGMSPDHPSLANPEPPALSPEDLEGVFETGYFNVNIVEALDLPEEAAAYQVFVTFKTHKSNVVKVVVEPGG